MPQIAIGNRNIRSFRLTGKSLSPRASQSLAFPILAGTPRNAPTPAGAGILPAARCACSAPVLRSAPAASWSLRNGDGFGSRAFRRLGRNVARSPATFRPDRALRRLRARHRRPARPLLSPTPSLRSRIAASTALRTSTPPRFARVRCMARPRASPESVCVTLNRRGAFGCSLSLRRSRILTQQSRALWAASL